LLDISVEGLTAVQVALAKRNGRDIISASSGRLGLSLAGAKPGDFSPIVDGHILPSDPFDPVGPAISKNKLLIVGYNRDEEAFFLQSGAADIFTLTFHNLEARLREDIATGPDPALAAHAAEIVQTYRASRPDASPTDLYIAIATARAFGLGSNTIAERKFAQHGAPVFAYIFTHRSDYIIPGTNHTIGAAHATEIPYKFNNVHDPSPRPEDTGLGNPEIIGNDPGRFLAAQNMSEMWTTFARTNHPGAHGQPTWPAYNTTDRPTMLIGQVCEVVNDPFSTERKFWAELQPI
jgi:para-nitrobenzyl esterase